MSIHPPLAKKINICYNIGMKSRDPNETTVCVCGCGKSIFRWHRNGNGTTKSKENRYVKGHCNRKIYRSPDELKGCECGCGEKIHRWVVSNGKVFPRENKFVLGHQSRNKPRPDFQQYLEKNVKGKDIRSHPKGSDHWAWKGGVAGESHKGRQSQEYKNWRDHVYARDNWTCQICFKKLKKDIVAHHYLSWTQYPEYRYTLWNGVTIDRKCHKEYFHPEIGIDTRFTPS